MQVFEKIKKVKPKKLFLIQDGPRNEDDLKKILECRKIVENIDWDCDVVRDYSETNLGCGVRPQSGISNAFKYVEKLIILEDDCVASESFFQYCEECLEKYKNDDRICYISGLNHFENWDAGGADYFFTKTGAIWGWATWKRAWTQYYDYYLKDMGNEYIQSLVEKQITHKYVAKRRMEACKRAQHSASTGEKLSYWDAQWGFVKYSQNMLVIVPRCNLICNIGTGVDSTHAKNIRKNVYRKYKNFVFIPLHELQFPLKHPKFCVCDTTYDNTMYKSSAGNPVRRILARILKRILRK